MMCYASCHVIFLIVLLYTGNVLSELNQHDECAVWRNITQLLAREDNINVVCARNQQCTGMDCFGNYSVSNGILPMVIDAKLCFGMFIHPCAHRTQLTVYVELQQPKNASFMETFEHNDTVLITGSHYGNLDGFLVVTMVPQKKNGEDYLLVGIRFKMRVNVSEVVLWPSKMQVTLVPDMYIPVPPCDPSAAKPKHEAYSCHVPHPAVPLPVRHTTPAPKDLLPGTACQRNMLGSCNDSEMCVAHDGDKEKGKCVCMTGATYNETSHSCIISVHDQTMVVPLFPYPDPTDGDFSTSLSKNMIIIIICSVGAVMIVSAVLTVIICRYRRHRARYGQHALLLTGEDDDDEDRDHDDALVEA